MDTKWKNFSHSNVAKFIVFIIVIICFTGAVTSFVNIVESNNGDINIAFEDNYYKSKNFIEESEKIVNTLITLLLEYKSEENILAGETITKDEIEREENNLYSNFQENSKNYNPNLNYDENYKVFKEIYADEIAKAINEMIEEDLREYNLYLKKLVEYNDLIYYANNGKDVFSSNMNTNISYIKSLPSYMIFDGFDEQVYPKEIKDNEYFYWIKSNIDKLDQRNSIIYLGFSNEFLKPRIEEWKENKVIVTNSLYKVFYFLISLVISFIYLIIVTGKKSFQDKKVYLNSFDRLYIDINLGLCLGTIAVWFALIQSVDFRNVYKIIIPVTMPLAIVGLVLVLSVVRHIKNKTIIRHTLIFTIFYKFYTFLRDIYDNGSVAVKVISIVILYPIIVASTFFIFPITIGLGAWFALKKIKEYNAIKEGVEKIKNGEIHHKVNIKGDGEFSNLANNINTLADGLNKAVENEIKSERLKAELITNVSHDIRTPLTSIITYVDLLKQEKDSTDQDKYIEIIEQKAHRLKNLTDDLFEASKASSGNIPVNYEKIDIISLITQGLGELNDKIEESKLDFKLNYPKEKVYIKADGRLLWRTIENLLSNIFKYALKGSRVYIDIDNIGNEIMITIKNISANELNISSDELMERFKRGDEARSSEGSGLGLSIAKSLIDIQNGDFNIEIDGDLFKAIIKIPKYNE